MWPLSAMSETELQLDTVSETKVVIVAALLASALFVHFRGRVKHKFARQVTDHSTFLAPYNALVYAFSRLPNRPFFRTEDFPELQRLTNNWEAIRDEGLRLLGEGKVGVSTGRNDLAFNSFFRRGWKRFYLKWYGDPLPSAKQFCPLTLKLLEEIPSVHAAMFALLPAGSRLGEHRDPFAGSIRYHLGLRTPNSDKCWIAVDGQRYAWRDGEAVLFDETYIHEAKNETDVDRLILFCDVERPLWGAAPRAINRFIIEKVVKITAAQNMEGEPIGLANRVFGMFFRMHTAGQRMKKWNRKAYYGLKYATMILIVYAVLFL
jgi:beta-hydroxylase